MLLLIEYYNLYKQKGLKTSENVLKWSQEYKEEVDKYFTFLSEMTEKSTTHISSADLYDNFKLWFKNKYPNDRVHNNRDFCNGIKKYYNIEKCVKIDGKVTTGIKNLALKNNEN